MNQIATRGDNENNIFKKASSASEVDDSSSQIKILVVDDKPAIAKQLGEMFAKSDWLVESASDEASALKACEHSGFSAIMISMALPGDSAVDLRRKLKTNHNVLNTPVIGMIVMGDENAQKKALDWICGLCQQTI